MEYLHDQIARNANQNPKTDPLIKHPCKCGCGQETQRAANHSKRYRKGEYQDYVYQHHRITHGCCRYNTYSSEYQSFLAARARCRNPNTKDWHLYGGAGITFDFKDFGEFFDELGFKPSPGHTIDRKDSTGNYAPGNVRWATRTDQNRNRRGIVLTLEKADAIRACVKAGFSKKELAERFGVGLTTIWAVVKNRTWVRE